MLVFCLCVCVTSTRRALKGNHALFFLFLSDSFALLQNILIIKRLSAIDSEQNMVFCFYSFGNANFVIHFIVLTSNYNSKVINFVITII